MKSIRISDLKVGNRFTKPLYLDKDNIFINANTPVTEADISRLIKFGFKEVLTTGELVTDPPPGSDLVLDHIHPSLSPLDAPANQLKNTHLQIMKYYSQLETVYKDVLNVVQVTYRKVADDKQIDIGLIRESAEKMVDHLKLNYHICYCLLNYPTTGYYLYNQVLFSTFFSIFIGQLLEYSRPRLIELAIAGLMADIGMAKVPSDISEKSESLNEEEIKTIKKHTLFGYQILTKVMKLKHNLAVISLQHHENFDGTGYPQRLQKKDIDELARIYTIADNFSSMIQDRPWRKKKLPYEAMKEMISVSSFKFDLAIVKLFLNKISMYPCGSWVELSDTTRAQVIESNDTKPLRPSIMILKDSTGRNLANAGFLNLAEDTKIYITKAIPAEN